MIILYIILVIVNVLMNIDNLMDCIYESLFIWFYNIFPSIFIFYNVSTYLIYNPLFKQISKILKVVIKFDSDTSYVILLVNILLGNPGTAKLITNAITNNEISDHDYSLLINVTFFMNPLFILSIINLKYYLIYLLSCLIFIKLYSLIFKYKYNSSNYINKQSYKYSFDIFSKSLNDVIYILLNVACLITFFNIFKTSIKYLFYLSNFTFFDIDIVLSFFEVANGLISLQQFNNIFLIMFLISFQGICILMQSYNILYKKNISFIRYIFIHLLSAFIITIIFYIITIIFHI